MTTPARHVYGPRPIGALVPDVTRSAFRNNDSSSAQVMIDWPSIVGPVLAAVTQPKRLANGTLTIACAGPVAMELQHLALEVVTRINTHTGRQIVRSLRFVQTSTLPPPPAGPPPSPPRAVAEAEAAVADLPEGELRSALVTLGSAVLAGRKLSTRTPNRR
jgi:hypothetical protein